MINFWAEIYKKSKKVYDFQKNRAWRSVTWSNWSEKNSCYVDLELVIDIKNYVSFNTQSYFMRLSSNMEWVINFFALLVVKNRNLKTQIVVNHFFSRKIFIRFDVQSHTSKWNTPHWNTSPNWNAFFWVGLCVPNWNSK